MSHNKPNPSMRLLRWVVGLGVLYVVVCLGTAFVLTAPRPFTTSMVSSTFISQRLTTQDGVELQIHHHGSHQRPLVVLAHDDLGSSRDFKEFARMLVQKDYEVLTFDFRGHGASDKSTVSGGVFEVEDVKAVCAWIRSERTDGLSSVAWIGVGQGAAAFTAAPEAPDFACAVLLDCYEDLEQYWDQRFRSTVHVGLRPAASLVAATMSWRIGEELHKVRPAQGLSRLSELQILLVHSRGENDAGVAIGERLFEAAGTFAELFIHELDPGLLKTLEEDMPTRREIIDYLDRML